MTDTHTTLIIVAAITSAVFFNIAYYEYMRRWKKRADKTRDAQLRAGFTLLKKNVSQLERLIELREPRRYPPKRRRAAPKYHNSN